MQQAVAQLDAAGVRAAKIARLLAEAEGELRGRKAARVGKGSGRMKSGEQKTDDVLNEKISRLRRGLLPGESAAITTAVPAELAASAGRHAQHHAAPATAPAGRPANASGAAHAGPAGSAAAASSSSAGDGDDGDGDDAADGNQLDEFGAQYYTVPPADNLRSVPGEAQKAGGGTGSDGGRRRDACLSD